MLLPEASRSVISAIGAALSLAPVTLGLAPFLSQSSYSLAVPPRGAWWEPLVILPGNAGVELEGWAPGAHGLESQLWLCHSLCNLTLSASVSPAGKNIYAMGVVSKLN